MPLEKNCGWVAKNAGVCVFLAGLVWADMKIAAQDAPARVDVQKNEEAPMQGNRIWNEYGIIVALRSEKSIKQ
jgi:hypothetical protein